MHTVFIQVEGHHELRNKVESLSQVEHLAGCAPRNF